MNWAVGQELTIGWHAQSPGQRYSRAGRHDSHAVLQKYAEITSSYLSFGKQGNHLVPLFSKWSNHLEALGEERLLDIRHPNQYGHISYVLYCSQAMEDGKKYQSGD